MSITDERLWKVARKRAAFKRHLSIYFLVNLFLWAIWWFTTESRAIFTGSIPWPLWTTLGWGLGLAFNYLDAYGAADKESAIEKEYEKLKAEERNKN
ncbi:MAG: 2TM domain-containing protein [Bacteroidota bacterium]